MKVVTRKLPQCAVLLVGLVWGSLSQANVIVDTHTISQIAPDSSSVDYTLFSVTTQGVFDLSATRSSGDIDTYLRLFADDGALDEADQLAFDDDGGLGLNSLISGFFLLVGDYILASGDFFLSVSEAVSGVNVDDLNNVETGTADIVISSSAGVAELRSASDVPVPAPLLLIGAGLAALAWTRRSARRK